MKILGIGCVLLGLIAVGMVYVVMENRLNPEIKCPNIDIPLELISVEIGDNDITFIYNWTKNNTNNLEIYGSEFDFSKYVKEGVTIDLITDINYFIPAKLEKGDTIRLKHYAKNTINFTDWYGQNKLYLQGKLVECFYTYDGGFNLR